MYTLYLVNEEYLLYVIEKPRTNKGLYFSIFDNYVIAVDNSTGDAWTETFYNVETALLWLIDKEKEV